MKLLVSACLLGQSCRYDGASKANPQVLRLSERYTLIPVCPEQLGGLPTPRPPAERQGERVVTADGKDVTQAYNTGAQAALRLYNQEGCRGAVLKERSPSCGCGGSYDGSFTRTLCNRDGVTAELLQGQNIPVYGESELWALLEMTGEE